MCRALQSLAFVAAASLGNVGCASAGPPPPAETLTVIKANVVLPRSTSGGFTETHFFDKDTYLLRSANRWYRAQLTRDCGRDEDRFRPIIFKLDATSTLSRYSEVILSNERICRIEKLDRIEPPKDKYR
jgi:hypothetical protein